MTLLLPLGLLGLLGIVALIIIYIIRPNYQQRSVSSTYIWKLSLKYKKRKLPVDRLRNLLLLICQILILALMAWILSKPATVIKAATLDNDVIAVIDSSASMYAESDGETRFERAVQSTIELANKTFAGNGKVSVILADSDPEYLFKRAPKTNSLYAIETLEELIAQNSTACSYGSSDIESALTLCEEVLEENPSAQIYLYTDIVYDYVPEDIEVVQVNKSDGSEWNAAILDVSAVQNDDASYKVTVDVASYGSGCNLNVIVAVYGANASDNSSAGETITYEETLYCPQDEEQRIVFSYVADDDENYSYDKTAEYVILESKERFFSYQSISVYIEVESTYVDSFSVDNTYMLYGGQKQVLKVQYASSDPNDFFTTALYVMKSYYSKQGLWDLQVTDVKEGSEPELEGYDFYIFEHQMPEKLPTDGVVLLVDPDPNISSLPSGIGLYATSVKDFNGKEISLLETEAHPVTQYLNSDDIFVSKYVKLDYDSSYKVLMTCNSDPAILVCNEVTDYGATQIAVLAFSVHYSNLSHSNGAIVTLLANLFDYFIPSTVSENAYDVNETITLNARSKELRVTGGANIDESYTEFPAEITLSLPGTYTISQWTYYGKYEEQYLFVKIPSEESNVQKKEGSLSSPNRAEVEEDSYIDWLVYLAGALVALIFIEWILKSHDNV